MAKLSSENDDSSPCYDVIIKHQNFKNRHFSSDIDFNSKTDVFRDVIPLIIKQSDPRRPQSVRQPRSANKRSALVYIYISIYICNELIEETARRRKLIFACGSLLAMAPVSSELRRKCRLIMEL